MFLRLLTTALVGLVFALVLLGGWVHTEGASLACPDWPLCYGMIMPPMHGDIALEHSHRLLASFVGVLTLVLWGTLRVQGGALRAQLGSFAAAGIGLVVLQGLLGGLTVMLRLPPPVSIAHWSLSMVFFGWTVAMAVRVRRSTLGVPSREGDRDRPLSGRALVWAAAATIWAQGVLGAAVRHTHASLSCGAQWLGCGAGLLPETGPQWLQTSHRLMAIVAVIAVGVGTVPALRAARAAGAGRVRALGRAAHLLVLLQVVFGALTLTSGIHLHVVLTHVGTGALLWAVLVAMAECMGAEGHASALGEAAAAVARRERLA